MHRKKEEEEKESDPLLHFFALVNGRPDGPESELERCEITSYFLSARMIKRPTEQPFLPVFLCVANYAAGCLLYVAVTGVYLPRCP